MCVCPDLPCVEYNKWKGGLFLKYRRSVIIYITIDSWIHGVTRLLKLSCKQHNATCFIGSKLMSDYEKSDKHTGFFALYSVLFTCVPLISIPFILLRLHMSKNVKETWCCWSLSRCSYRACTALLLLAFLEVKWHALSTCRGPGSWHPRHSEILPPSSSENSLSTNLSHQSLLLTHSQPGKKKQLYLMFSERNSPIWLNSVNPFSPPPIIALLKC